MYVRIIISISSAIYYYPLLPLYLHKVFFISPRWPLPSPGDCVPSPHPLHTPPDPSAEEGAWLGCHVTSCGCGQTPWHAAVTQSKCLWPPFYSESACLVIGVKLSECHIQCSWKYLQELHEPKIAIARILADLNLAVRYRIAIHIYASKKFWWILIWRL